MEKYLWVVDRVCRINFIMHARIQGVLNEKVMRRGLDAIQARHPLLRVRIERDGRSNLRFCSGRVPEIPLRVADALPEDWTREAEKDLNAIFSTSVGPPRQVHPCTAWNGQLDGPPYFSPFHWRRNVRGLSHA